MGWKDREIIANMEVSVSWRDSTQEWIGQVTADISKYDTAATATVPAKDKEAAVYGICCKLGMEILEAKWFYETEEE